MSGSFAYHAPTQPEAYVAPQGIRDRMATGGTDDAFMNKAPDNMDAGTHDVVSNMSRLSGARGVPNLKERGA